MGDPYLESVRTAKLAALAHAIGIVDDRADLNHRYQALIDDSRIVLDSNRIRLTQVRGLAKRLVVLAKAAGPEMRARLTRAERDLLDVGLAQADGLIRTAGSGEQGRRAGIGRSVEECNDEQRMVVRLESGPAPRNAGP